MSKATGRCTCKQREEEFSVFGILAQFCASHICCCCIVCISIQFIVEQKTCFSDVERHPHEIQVSNQLHVMTIFVLKLIADEWWWCRQCNCGKRVLALSTWNDENRCLIVIIITQLLLFVVFTVCTRTVWIDTFCVKKWFCPIIIVNYFLYIKSRWKKKGVNFANSNRIWMFYGLFDSRWYFWLASRTWLVIGSHFFIHEQSIRDEEINRSVGQKLLSCLKNGWPPICLRRWSPFYMKFSLLHPHTWEMVR